MSTAGPGAGGDAHAAASCEPLRRLVSLADTRFDRLRGYRDPRLRTWVATYRMPGASLCTIEDDAHGAIYTCTWRSDPAADTASATYEDLLRQVDACLDVRGDGAQAVDAATSVARFGIAGARKSVLVTKRESPGSPHLVTLEIVPLALEEIPAQ